MAIGSGSQVYSVDNTTLVEINPVDGDTLRSLGGLSIANAVTPILSDGYLWAFSRSQTLIFDLDPLSLAGTLPGSRGSLNSAFDGPGALDDRHFLLDYGTIYNRPGFDAYVVIPEPSTLVLALACLGLLAVAVWRRRAAR